MNVTDDRTIEVGTKLEKVNMVNFQNSNTLNDLFQGTSKFKFVNAKN